VSANADVTVGLRSARETALRGAATASTSARTDLLRELAARAPTAGRSSITPTAGLSFSVPRSSPCRAGDCGRRAMQTTGRLRVPYQSSITGEFGGYAPASPPSDIANTTTEGGKTVRHIGASRTGLPGPRPLPDRRALRPGEAVYGLRAEPSRGTARPSSRRARVRNQHARLLRRQRRDAHRAWTPMRSMASPHGAVAQHSAHTCTVALQGPSRP